MFSARLAKPLPNRIRSEAHDRGPEVVIVEHSGKRPCARSTAEYCLSVPGVAGVELRHLGLDRPRKHRARSTKYWPGNLKKPVWMSKVESASLGCDVRLIRYKGQYPEVRRLCYNGFINFRT